MSIETGTSPGHVIIDKKLEFFKEVPSNKPYCHFCRQRVDAVTILERSDAGNPLHICKDCTFERLAGFDAIENA